MLVADITPWNLFKNIVVNEFSGVGEIAADIDTNLPYEIYNLNGVKVGNNIEGLASGVYIIRQGQNVKKVSVK